MKLSLMHGRSQTLDIPNHYYEDCLRIMKALSVVGFVVDVHEAKQIWIEYSQSMSAGWIILPEKNTDIIRALVEINGVDYSRDYEYEEWDKDGWEKRFGDLPV